jgi:hypothetical protein
VSRLNGSIQCKSHPARPIPFTHPDTELPALSASLHDLDLEIDADRGRRLIAREEVVVGESEEERRLADLETARELGCLQDKGYIP